MPADLDAILKIEVPIIVQIGERRMTVREAVALVPGAIIELPKPADDELEILINNKPVGTGTAVKVGENFGIRIAYLGDVHARIEALAGQDSADIEDQILASVADQLVGS